MSRKCDLCGLIDHRVRPGIVRTPEGEYRALARCTDHQACQERLRRNGMPWPVSRSVGGL